MWNNRLSAAVAVLLLRVSSASAEANCDRVDRNNVVECAVSRSVGLDVARLGVDVAKGRELAVSPLLPSNPLLALSGGHRASSSQRATNWYATLSQEVEIAGQRRVRRKAAAAAVDAQEQAVEAASRDVARDAWLAYFQVLAARDALTAAERLEQTFQGAVIAVRAAAANGVVAGIDADVAEASAVRLSQERIAAKERLARSNARLATLLGKDPMTQLDVVGELAPLHSADSASASQAAQALEHRPEVLAAEASRNSYQHWADAYRRQRAPNLTVSVFAQRDGFNERVLGGGIGLPIPLPSPVGRTFRGEIEEAQALTRQADRNREQLLREARREVADAVAAFEAAKAQLGLFSAERLERTERTLTSLAAEITQGRLGISSAIVAQQALIELLRASVEARLAACQTSVELVRAAGLPLVGNDL